ncbi:DUF1311 domain-containing protein [Erwinia amylovora]|nr:lysozyme inhibitor LprI family protein [Erwinia amylovora]MBZ2400626.1 DUF1311 domain-containing protein [Erwinia amylovora]MBZ2404213.1 DUF1311 domain-containing protein [Erwinia amylovora]UDJ86158.1 DUF1311 domain-containing protein [Erwinia amylovora]UDJ97621.1 DUF1311 domain-containing protein [Erwinia amylovora]UDK90319.1 DUF1311 domain-containing protein [Erwinia amylovora]
MKFGYRLVVAILSFCVGASAMAEDICAKALSDGSVYQCSVKQKKLAEDDLNKEYATAKKRIIQMYGAEKELGEQYVATVIDTQRHWLKYRDGQCKLEAFAAEEGSNANATAVNICITRIDKERSEMLKQMPY